MPAASPRSPISEVAPPDTVIITTRSPSRQRREIEQRRGLDQRVDRVDQRHAVLPEQRRERLVPAGERAGVRERRALAELAAAELQHDHRLHARGALDRGAEAAAVLGALHDAGDDLGRRIVGEELDVVGHLQHGLVAAGDEIIDADAAIGGELGERIHQPAALRDERDAAGRRVARDVRHGGGEAIAEARDAHAVGPGERHVGRARERDEPRLPRAALVAGGVGKTFRHHVGARGCRRAAASPTTSSTASAGTDDHHAVGHGAAAHAATCSSAGRRSRRSSD